MPQDEAVRVALEPSTPRSTGAQRGVRLGDHIGRGAEARPAIAIRDIGSPAAVTRCRCVVRFPAVDRGHGLYPNAQSNDQHELRT